MQSGTMNEAMLKAVGGIASRAWRDKEQEHYKSRAVDVITTVSHRFMLYFFINKCIVVSLHSVHSAYSKVREEMAFESKKEAAEREPTPKAKLPPLLRNFPELETLVFKMVIEMGGGWNVKWQESQWRNRMFDSFLPEEEEEDVTQKGKEKDVLSNDQAVKLLRV